MAEYKIKIIAEIKSSLTRKRLEEMLVISLFDTETDVGFVDGENTQLEVLDYRLTEAIPVS